MTIDDRLTRAGELFRASHTTPAHVDLAAPAAARPRRRPPRRPRPRLLGIAVAVCAVIALTAGVVAWVATSGAAPRPQLTTAAGPDDALGALTTGTWRLVTVETDSAPALRPTLPFTLTVVPRSTGQGLNLDDGCNATNVPVDIEPGTIRVTGQAVTSLVGCERPTDPAVAARAPVFAAATITWSISGTDLRLSAAGVTLTFKPDTSTAPTVIGRIRTSWQLVAVVDGGDIVPVTTARSTELQFDATPGSVTVGDGCNSVGGAYTLDRTTLVFTGLTTTDMACSDTAALQQAVDRVFREGSAQAEQAGNRLTLRRDDVVLTYDSTGVG